MEADLKCDCSPRNTRFLLYSHDKPSLLLTHNDFCRNFRDEYRDGYVQVFLLLGSPANHPIESWYPYAFGPYRKGVAVKLINKHTLNVCGTVRPRGAAPADLLKWVYPTGPRHNFETGPRVRALDENGQATHPDEKRVFASWGLRGAGNFLGGEKHTLPASYLMSSLDAHGLFTAARLKRVVDCGLALRENGQRDIHALTLGVQAYLYLVSDYVGDKTPSMEGDMLYPTDRFSSVCISIFGTGDCEDASSVILAFFDAIIKSDVEELAWARAAARMYVPCWSLVVLRGSHAYDAHSTGRQINSHAIVVLVRADALLASLGPSGVRMTPGLFQTEGVDDALPVVLSVEGTAPATHVMTVEAERRVNDDMRQSREIRNAISGISSREYRSFSHLDEGRYGDVLNLIPRKDYFRTADSECVHEFSIYSDEANLRSDRRGCSLTEIREKKFRLKVYYSSTQAYRDKHEALLRTFPQSVCVEPEDAHPDGEQALPGSYPVCVTVLLRVPKTPRGHSRSLLTDGKRELRAVRGED
jgi:hypothetical protein